MVNTLAVDNEAKQTIEALQTELQKTKEKLQALEELKSQSGIKHCAMVIYIHDCDSMFHFFLVVLVENFIFI